MSFWKIVLPSLGILLLGSVNPLHATVDLTLHGHSVGGPFVYAGGNSPMSGTFWPGSYRVDGSDPNWQQNGDFVWGTMQFWTGQPTGNDSTHWFFGPGGSLSVTGSLNLHNNFQNIAVPFTSLFTGSFLDFTITRIPSVSPVASVFLISGHVMGSINPELTKFLGIPDGAYFGTLGVETASWPSAVPPDPILASGYRDLLLDLTPVPEPSSVVLLITVASALCWRMRRDKAKPHISTRQNI